MQSTLPKSEWTYLIKAETVPDKGRHVKMKPTAEECTAISKRIGADSVSNVTAELAVTPQNGGHVLYIQGHFSADVVQSCIVSNKPVPSHIEEDFEAWYADHEKAVPFKRAKHDAQLKADGEEVQMLEEHEDPEPMVDGQVDLGDLVSQYMSLAVNPYPRHPDHIGEDSVAEEPKKATAFGGANRPNPFAALKNWRPKD